MTHLAGSPTNPHHTAALHTAAIAGRDQRRADRDRARPTPQTLAFREFTTGAARVASYATLSLVREYDFLQPLDLLEDRLTAASGGDPAEESSPQCLTSEHRGRLMAAAMDLATSYALGTETQAHAGFLAAVEDTARSFADTRSVTG